MSLANCGGDAGHGSGPEGEAGGATGGQGPGAGAGGSGGAGGSAGGNQGPDTYCVTPRPAAVERFVTLEGFTPAEDFAFDDQGRVVSVDENGSLVRMGHDGTSEIWVTNVAQTMDAAGLAFLPSGELVLSDGMSTLLLVTPSGGVDSILSGLEYPNGVDVDLDGYVYVSEQNAGRVRRVDVATGEYEVIASGLYNPNGLAFSPDYTTLYCGSFGGGIIYAIEREAGGQWSVREFARTPYAPGAPDDTTPCDGLAEGDACEGGGAAYVCTATDLGLQCLPAGPCHGLSEGDPCESEFGPSGVCELQSGRLACVVAEPCSHAAPNEPCVNPVGVSGLCVEDPVEGGLYCGIVGACAGLEAGATCGAGGSCVDDGMGGLTCEVPDPCVGHLGEACTTDWGESGTCTDDGWGIFCRPAMPCDGLAAGDTCSFQSWSEPPVTIQGTCRSLEVPWGGAGGAGPVPFLGGSAGAGGAGGGQGGSGGGGDWEYLDCVPPDPCETLELGAPCESPWDGSAGTCMDAGDGSLTCSASTAGGLDGIGVDACGFVYVTEFTLGKVWRITPDGATVELVTNLPSSWIPNINFGTGRGGFREDALYVADRDSGRLFELPVGVRGRPLPFP